MTTDTSVKYFDSSMSGAPALSNTAGTLINVLDACLVNGFGSMTLTSLVIAGNVATATKTGHGFVMRGSTGPVIAISGATPAELNTEFRIQSIPDSNTFTFATSGIADQTATGTISAKRAPAGFSKAFSGTNKGAYQSNDPAGTQLFLRMDDTTTTYARMRGYEAIADQTAFDGDTATGPFPTDAQLSGGLYLLKSPSGAVGWKIFADHRSVYIHTDYSTWQSSGFFGDLDSYISPDAYCCAVMAHTTNSITSAQLPTLNATGGYLARSYIQTGSAITLNKYSHQKTTSIGDASGISYPIPVVGALLWPVEVWDSATQPRGLLPGAWNPIVDDINLAQATIISDIPQIPGRDFMAQTVRVGKMVYDLTGPWQ